MGDPPATASPTPHLTMTSRAHASMADDGPAGGDRNLQLFLTGTTKPHSSPSPSPAHALEDSLPSPGMVTHDRRIGREDLMEALGPVEQRKGVVVYVCGPARMTDEFVEVMGRAEGMEAGRVFCEKWW